MPAPVRTPRAQWVAEGLRTLAEEGVDAVRVESVAKGLGVTKGGFYWHFRDRAALLAAMLDTWEQSLVDQVIEEVDRGGGDGRARLRRLFAAAGKREDYFQLEMSVRDWARRDRAVAERVTRVDDRRMAFLRRLFAEFCDDGSDVEGRCLLVLALFVGESSIGATHGRRSRPSVVAAALRHLLS